jgi:hypothetical protein
MFTVFWHHIWLYFVRAVTDSILLPKKPRTSSNIDEPERPVYYRLSDLRGGTNPVVCLFQS